MLSILNKIFDKLINEKKGFKVLAWSFILAILLAIVFYPIIDANFLYYNRTHQRIEIVQKIANISVEDIKKDERLEEEYNSILDDMSKQRSNSINNIFQKETNIKRKFVKFFSGAWLFVFIGIIMPFTKDKEKSKRFTLNNFFAGFLCIVIGGIIGFFCYKIPNIISIGVNVVLYQIVLIFLAYTIATSTKKAQ